MKKASLQSIIFSVAAFLLLSVLMPFSVSADSVSGSSPIIGVNITILDREVTYQYTGLTVSLDDNNDRWRCVSFNSSGACNAYQNADNSNGNIMNHTISGDIDFIDTQQSITTIYEYEFILDSSYVGYVIFSNSFGNNSNSTYYINGSSFKVTSTTLNRSFTISNYNLYRNDLGNVWNFPIESFPWCSYLINSQWSKYYGLNSYNSYMFPLFKFSQNDIIYAGNTGGSWTWDLILYANQSINNSNITNRLAVNKTYTDEYVFKNWTMINRYNFEGSLGYLFKVQIEFKLNGSSNPFTLSYIGSNDVIIMPIYFNPVYEKSYISTDFALNFGLSNQLLDDIHKIAESTPETEAAEQSLDDQTGVAESSFTQFEQVESGFNDDLTDSLDQIAITTPGAMGSKFQASAIWVKTQFDRITGSTPFGSILGFSLLLGISLLIVGRTLR